jgi:hypothetical protein
VTVATRVHAGRRGRTPLPDVVRLCAAVFLAMRSLTLVSALAAGAFPSLPSQGVPGWAAPPVHPGWSSFLSAFERFDALWFLRIAASGYRSGDGSAAFFPLYPIVTRGVSAVIGGHVALAGTVVSNAAFLAALVVLHRLTEEEFDRETARWSVVVLAFLPTAYFYVLPYSESLFLLCVLASFLAARRRAWAPAGATAALASLTRSVGIVLVAALAIEALHQHVERRGSPLPGFLAAAAAAAGTMAYAAWWQVRGGDFLIPLVRQQNWERAFSWPWVTVGRGITIAADRWGSPSGGYWLFDLAIAVPALALGVVVAARMRPTYVAYAWGSLLAPLSFVFAGRPLMSMPRFAITVFPLTWIVARWAKDHPGAGRAFVAASAVTLVVVCAFTIDWFYVF